MVSGLPRACLFQEAEWLRPGNSTRWALGSACWTRRRAFLMRGELFASAKQQNLGAHAAEGVQGSAHLGDLVPFVLQGGARAVKGM